MFVFSRRAQKSMFAQAEGQAGAAGWMLQQQLRGDWRLTQAVAGTTQLDAVHRLVGRPGRRAGRRGRRRTGSAGLIAQEKKRTARVVGDTPIYDIIIGTGEGDLRLSKLNRYLLKLPANLSKDQVGDAREAARRARRLAGRPAAARARCRRARRCATCSAPSAAARDRRPMTNPGRAPQAYRGEALGLPAGGPGLAGLHRRRAWAPSSSTRVASALVAALFVAAPDRTAPARSPTACPAPGA